MTHNKTYSYMRNILLMDLHCMEVMTMFIDAYYCFAESVKQEYNLQGV